MSEEHHTLSIASVRRETRDAVSFGLEVPSALASAFRFTPGQHIGVRAIIGGEEVRRTYSISAGPDDRLLWITIKRVPAGLFSTWAHDMLEPGGVLDCMAPAGRLVLPTLADGARPRRAVAIVAGSGITPVVSIAEHLLAREPQSSLTLVYGNRTVDDIIFRERLEGLKSRHLERLQIFHVLSRDSEADVPLLAGRIDADKLRAIASDLRLGPADDILLCGPDTLIKDSRDALMALGAARERIRFEYFRAGRSPPALVAGGRLPAGESPATSKEPATTREAVAIVDGTRRTFPVAEGQRVIDAALAAGIRLPYSCKGGMCCTCRAKLIEGDVVMDRNFSLQDWEMEAGFVLTCQARAVTDRVVLDYDAA